MIPSASKVTAQLSLLAAPPSVSSAVHPLLPIAFVLGHVPLALVMRGDTPAATLHAFATCAVALGAAIGGRLELVACLGAYIVGAEVLWRMSGAEVPWEVGKYAVAGTFLIALARARPLRLNGAVVAFFLLLVPSIAVAPYELLSLEARKQISFNLSGPFALTICVLVLSHVRLSGWNWVRIATALVGPAVGMMAIGIASTVSSDDLQFTTESNVVTSGGFGPNQVSMIAGLGALMALLGGANARSHGIRGAFFAGGFLLASYSAMTFARGGVLTALAAAAVTGAHLLRHSRMRTAVGVTVAMVVLVVGILPQLNAFTGGMLGARFAGFDTTGRALIARDDVRLFLEHPIAGVGPGGARTLRASREPAHTEFTRLLAEHGLLGVFALAILVGLTAVVLLRRRLVRDRALCAGLITWSLLTMLHAGMRTVAPAFVFGLAFGAQSSASGDRVE